MEYNDFDKLNKAIEERHILITENGTIRLYDNLRTDYINIADYTGYMVDFYAISLPYLTKENKTFIKTFLNDWMDFITNTIKSIKTEEIHLKSNKFIYVYLKELDKDNKFNQYHIDKYESDNGQILVGYVADGIISYNEDFDYIDEVTMNDLKNLSQTISNKVLKAISPKSEILNI